MQNKRNLYIAFGLALAAILILVIGLVYNKFGSERPTTGTSEAVKTDAKKGEVIVNFPMELIVEADLIVKDSYFIKYDYQDLFFVSYYSRFSIDENLSLIRDRLIRKGYEITNDSKSEDGVYFVDAKNQYGEVNIVITQSDPDTQPNVTVVYAKF